MAKHVWTVLCERMLQDTITKTVSLVQIADAFDLYPVPPIPPKGKVGAINSPTLMLVSLWTRTNEKDGDEYKLRAGAKLPNGTQIVMQPATFKFTTVNYRQAFRLPYIPYSGLGRYWFFVEGSIDGSVWERGSEVPVDLREGKPPEELPLQVPQKATKRHNRKTKRPPVSKS